MPIVVKPNKKLNEILFYFSDRINWIDRISAYCAKKYPVNPASRGEAISEAR
jgi:hypothetical protein